METVDDGFYMMTTLAFNELNKPHGAYLELSRTFMMNLFCENS